MSHETPLITLTPKDITIILWVSRNQHYFKTSIQKKKNTQQIWLLPFTQGTIIFVKGLSREVLEKG